MAIAGVVIDPYTAWAGEAAPLSFCNFTESIFSTMFVAAVLRADGTQLGMLLTFMKLGFRPLSISK
jgi:hypothetical protein